MSASKNQRRPQARHRSEPAAPLTRSRSILKKTARRGTSQRMAVAAGVMATLLGVASISQAATQAISTPELNRASATQPNHGGNPLEAELSDATAIRQDAAEQKAAVRAAAKAEEEAAAKAAAEKAAADKAAADAAAAEAAAKAAAEAAAPVAVDDPAGAKAYAASVLASYGWGQGEMKALNTLWEKESNWRTTATNASSGAYGIVQSLPASKMASAGADWQTNYKTQIKWGLNYIKERYGSPSAALSFHYANNWY